MKRFFINLIICLMTLPVNMILKMFNISLEIRAIWVGFALGCCVNMIMDLIAER